MVENEELRSAALDGIEIAKAVQDLTKEREQLSTDLQTRAGTIKKLIEDNNNLQLKSNTMSGLSLWLKTLDFGRFSAGNLLNISHCHEVGDNCSKDSANHEIVHNTTKKENMENKVVELSAQSFDAAVLKNDKDVFVVFYAPWCGYCKRLCKSSMPHMMYIWYI